MTTTMTQLGAKMSEILDAVYPVGSVYMSVNATSPTTLFGGTWERLKDTFLLAAGDTYAAGATGGEATHTLTEGELPSHTHSLQNHTHSLQNHTHTTAIGAHTHQVVLPEMYNNDVVFTNSDSAIYSWKSNRGGTTSKSYVRANVNDNDRGVRSTNLGSKTSGGPSNNTSGGPSNNTSGSAGSGDAHNNMPPYLTVYMWKRTA